MISLHIISNEGIDSRLADQLNEILHHPEFQRLEASWRGPHYLVSQSSTGVQLKIRVLNVSKQELHIDLENTTEFRNSALFKKVYDDNFKVIWGEPFGVLLGDYEFGNHQHDIGLLESIAKITHCAHAPFIAAAAPQLFNMESFVELPKLYDPAKIFYTPEYARWRAFRESEDSRYVGLVLPRIQLRLPYRPDTIPVKSFSFREDVDTHGKRLWGNGAHAFGTRLTDAFARYGWCASICGVEGGGIVEP